MYHINVLIILTLLLFKLNSLTENNPRLWSLNTLPQNKNLPTSLSCSLLRSLEFPNRYTSSFFYFFKFVYVIIITFSLRSFIFLLLIYCNWRYYIYCLWSVFGPVYLYKFLIHKGLCPSTKFFSIHLCYCISNIILYIFKY